MEDLTSIRHYLHQHPELSTEEIETQEFILEQLSELNTDKVDEIAETGVLVQFKGKAEGRNILFRGDTDALPIQETINPGYKSEINGVSHKCGHDGHTTIMLGLCRHYSEHRPERGNVYIIFQPGEEIGWGAKKAVESGMLETLDIYKVIALHNVPGYPLKEVVCREGSFTPAVTTLIAYFKGYTSHAAEPWNGKNPAAAMSRYLLKALEYNHENKEQHHFVTITPVYTEMGEKAYGTSAGEGSVHLTIRADSSEKLNEVLEAIKADGEQAAKEAELKVDYEEQERFESNQNDAEAISLIQDAAKSCGLNYTDKDEPFRWGEDFGLFTNIYPGAMFGLGAGEDCKPLHHPDYDYPDEITETAIDIFKHIQIAAQQ